MTDGERQRDTVKDGARERETETQTESDRQRYITHKRHTERQIRGCYTERETERKTKTDREPMTETM